MPRNPRKYLNTSYFHLITQGINKSYIFNKSEDIKYYIKIMYELKEYYSIKIIAYCIMNNHAHILTKVEKIEELSKYMQRLNTKYAKYYNKKYNRIGYVFRDRYKSEGIYNEKHLYNCIKYIYNNPVKAGICKEASEYAYSNYKKIDKIYPDDDTFIDVYEEEERNANMIIQNYLTENKINMAELKESKEKLCNIIRILKEEYDLPFVKISNALNMNREKIRRIYNMKQ